MLPSCIFLNQFPFSFALCTPAHFHLWFECFRNRLEKNSRWSIFDIFVWKSIFVVFIYGIKHTVRHSNQHLSFSFCLICAHLLLLVNIFQLRVSEWKSFRKYGNKWIPKFDFCTRRVVFYVLYGRSLQTKTKDWKPHPIPKRIIYASNKYLSLFVMKIGTKMCSEKWSEVFCWRITMVQRPHFQIDPYFY